MKRAVGLSLILFFAACGSFDAGDNPPSAIAPDGGTSSSSGFAEASVEAGPSPCVRVPASNQPFTNGETGSWVTSQGTQGTLGADLTNAGASGKNSDGAIAFNYESDPTHARRTVVETTLPNTARCFELVVDFLFTYVANRELIFTEVKFQNRHLLGLAIETDLNVVLAQQDLDTGDFGPVAATTKPTTTDDWHEAIVRLELKDGGLVVSASLDGVDFERNDTPLLSFDQTQSVEAGVSYVTATGSGEIVIDRVAFQ